jgi:glutamate/tyrosine decarboxylase-like PLP-dependent enzyme
MSNEIGNANDAKSILDGLSRLAQWQTRWPQFDSDETLRVSAERVQAAFDELLTRLEENYPFFHPTYAGQMLKPPHAVASVAYFLAQQINPNNHALDGGPATARMEREAVSALAAMFGFATHLGHLTSSGTMANLEALWVARELHPDRAIAFSDQAHYTHRRMCEVINARAVEIPSDARGRIDLDALCDKLKTGEVGTVVVTAGTTALGAVDPVDAVLEMRREFEFRVHVDAAYGGFFTLLAQTGGLLGGEEAQAFRAIASCDSVVVDPHKHGLQPYGCGAVLFRDPSVGRFYRHDSPYTYFTSDELHLGEISLECSRAGAAAAALWTTLQCFPLKADEGLGAVLCKTRQAAREWARLIAAAEELSLVLEPSLDIIAFFPARAGRRVSEISAATNRLFAEAMNDPEHPVYLAKLKLKPALLVRHGDLIWDEPALTVLRSVLMKPEHLAYVPTLHRRVLKLIKG